jgi:flagellar hook-associated protein 2
MAAVAPAYTANGLSSGLNDSAIIQSLVGIRQQPINQLQTEQAGIQTQVSDLGTIASQLTALQSAIDAFATGGAVASQVTSTNTAFTATASTQATPGQYAVQVTALATAAKARSQGFASTSSPVTGGTLALTVQGTQYNLTITDGESLSDVATALNQLGAPINATILSDGTNQYLEVTDAQTGYPIGTTAANALSITETDTGTQGQDLNLAVFQSAANAAVTVDGLATTQTSNQVSDLIPGVTLNLSSTETSPENLVIATDPTATQTNLQTFVAAYNTLNASLQAQLNPPLTTNADGSTSAQPAPLSNDAGVLGLEQQLQQILTTIVPGVNGFNSLASIGITSSDQDGSISIDTSLLNNALNSNPAAVNQLFAQASTGIAAAFDSLSTTYADPATGVFTQEESQLNTRIQQMTQQQFANMEQLVSNFKSVGQYLTQLSQAQVANSPGGNG